MGVIDESIHNSDPPYRNEEQEQGVKADVTEIRREDTKSEGPILQQIRLTDRTTVSQPRGASANSERPHGGRSRCALAFDG